MIKNKGFTLVETITSVGILALVIVGPLSVIINSSSYARQTKDIVIASYLAEEPVELLQNQYDSLYIFCQKKPDDPFCTASLNETSVAETVWRQFKDRLGPVNSQSSCYYSQNPDGTTGNQNGCTFDYSAMVNISTTTAPVRYDALSSACPYLVEVATTTTITQTTANACYATYIAQHPNSGSDTQALYNFSQEYCASHNAEGEAGNSICISDCISNRSVSTEKSIQRHVYVCKGAAAATAGAHGTIGVKPYTRTISVEEVSTFESGLPNTQYNDDLRISSSVQFRGLNGFPHTVKVVRFMHALP